MSDATTVWGEIDGQTITFPMEVTDFDAATLMFSVPADAAQALLPGQEFEVVEMVDGWAQLVIALCDYHQNPWGDYKEINLGFLARPRGASADVVGSFVYAMPVDQEFTCKAGNQVMGFPKTVETIRFERPAGQIRVVLMVASVAVALVAMGLRVKALMYTGSAFLVADIIAMVVRGTIDNPNLLWITGIGVGAAVISLAAYCERHREDMLQQLRVIAAKLEAWE